MVANELGFEQMLPCAAKHAAIVEEYHSPKSPVGKMNGFALEVPKADVVRAVTPELVPDRMGSRIPAEAATMLFQGTENEDSPFLRMGARVAPLSG
jgi:glucosamine-6-phosphate deaminase